MDKDTLIRKALDESLPKEKRKEYIDELLAKEYFRGFEKMTKISKNMKIKRRALAREDIREYKKDLKTIVNL